MVLFVHRLAALVLFGQEMAQPPRTSRVGLGSRSLRWSRCSWSRLPLSRWSFSSCREEPRRVARCRRAWRRPVQRPPRATGSDLDRRPSHGVL